MGRQINFYLMPKDILELNEYLKQNKWIVFSAKQAKSKLEFVDSVKRIDFLLLEKHKEQVKMKFIEKQNHYSPDIILSPIIQFRNPPLDIEKKILRRGRVYYTKDFWQADKLIDKDEEFLKAAQKLFAWIRRHFKNTKYVDGFLVSERAKQWAIENNGYLPPNNMSQREWKIWEAR